MLAREGDEALVERQIGDIGGRVRRIAHHQHLGPRNRVAHGAGQTIEEGLARRGRNRADRGSGDDEAEGVDRVGGVGRKHHVAGGGDRLGKIGEPFLGAESDDDLGFRVHRDPEAALVVGRLGLAQAGNALARGIAMGVWLACHFAKLVDHVARRRAVGVAHAEIDDVLAARPSRGLHRVDLREDVGRQPANAIEVRIHCAAHDGDAAVHQSLYAGSDQPRRIASPRRAKPANAATPAAIGPATPSRLSPTSSPAASAAAVT